MKKKILSLLLVVSFVFAFTIISFAYSKTINFRLWDNDIEVIKINSYDIDRNDDKVIIDVEIDDQNADYRISVYNVDEARVIFDEYERESLMLAVPINHRDSYIVCIQNRSGSMVQGSLGITVR